MTSISCLEILRCFIIQGANLTLRHILRLVKQTKILSCPWNKLTCRDYCHQEEELLTSLSRFGEFTDKSSQTLTIDALSTWYATNGVCVCVFVCVCVCVCVCVHGQCRELTHWKWKSLFIKIYSRTTFFMVKGWGKF